MGYGVRVADYGVKVIKLLVSKYCLCSCYCCCLLTTIRVAHNCGTLRFLGLACKYTYIGIGSKIGVRTLQYWMLVSEVSTISKSLNLSLSLTVLY